VINPMYDRVLVKRAESAKKTKGGLIIPGMAQNKMLEGEVKAVGEGKVINGKIIPLQVQVGDVIIFDAQAGSEVSVEGETFLLLREERIFGIK